MKIEINLPSIGIGVLLGMALPAIPVASLGLFAYAPEQWPWVTGSIVALAAMGALVASEKPFEGKAPISSIRDHMHKKFPTTSPASIDWQEIEGSLTPVEWLKGDGGGTLRNATFALSRQVSDPVHGDIETAIMAALNALIDQKKNAHWGVDELARRMWAAHQSSTRFDLLDYMRVMRTTYPNVDLSAKGPSPFATIRIAKAVKEARESGVLAAADFLWLRLFDRRLWYVIDNVGRRSFHVEALGVAAHLAAQRRSGSTLETPAIAGALDGIRAYHDLHGIELRGWSKPE